MNSLPQLLTKWSPYTDKESGHCYGEIYEQWLSHQTSIHYILEIGCNSFGGGSLLAFSERFPNAITVGLDITFTQIVDEVNKTKNIQLFQGDAYQNETVEKFQNSFSSKFDLVIDDCLHSPDEQYQIFQQWNEILSFDGLYIIEDVSDLDAISRKLSNYNHEWSIRLGDARTDKRECPNDSVLLGLQRCSKNSNLKNHLINT
jgi:SAM-dependent methyltransferase